jgi:hypothetical protein
LRSLLKQCNLVELDAGDNGRVVEHVRGVVQCAQGTNCTISKGNITSVPVPTMQKVVKNLIIKSTGKISKIALSEYQSVSKLDFCYVVGFRSSRFFWLISDSDRPKMPKKQSCSNSV